MHNKQTQPKIGQFINVNEAIELDDNLKPRKYLEIGGVVKTPSMQALVREETPEGNFILDDTDGGRFQFTRGEKFWVMPHYGLRDSTREYVEDFLASHRSE